MKDILFFSNSTEFDYILHKLSINSNIFGCFLASTSRNYGLPNIQNISYTETHVIMYIVYVNMSLYVTICIIV